MAPLTSSDRQVAVLYSGGTAALTPEALDREIRRVWADLASSAAGRARVARVLGVDPSGVQEGDDAVPLVAEGGTSGFLGVDLAVAIHWSAVNIAIPVLVGLTKDEAKARLVQLWRQVIKPAIDGDGRGDKFGDELSPPR